MENLLRLIPVFLLSILIIPTVNAQVDAEPLAVNATVIQNITLQVVRDVSFGNIQSDGDPIIDPQGTNTSDVAETAALGLIKVTAQASTALAIEWDKNQTVLGDGVDKTITFTANVATNTTDTPSGSTNYTEGSSIQTSTDGELFIYIGGDLGTLSNQAAGTYTSGASNGGGDITFTVNYN